MCAAFKRRAVHFFRSTLARTLIHGYPEALLRDYVDGAQHAQAILELLIRFLVSFITCIAWLKTIKKFPPVVYRIVLATRLKAFQDQQQIIRRADGGHVAAAYIDRAAGVAYAGAVLRAEDAGGDTGGHRAALAAA